ncbi:MAG: SAM-dependent methyltransferase [Alphaproteobacteria bacterium]
MREDSRVRILERTNVRTLAASSLVPVPSLAVIDASFISLRLLLGPTMAQLGGRRDVIALVKPQFEVARDQVSEGGLVRDPEVRHEVRREVRQQSIAVLPPPSTMTRRPILVV